MTLRDRKILTFDVVGTLIDFEAGIINYVRSLAHESVVEPSNAAILNCFARAEAGLHSVTPGASFIAMLPPIYLAMATEFKLPTNIEAAEGLRLSVPEWPAFPDSINALKRLKKRFRLVATTNVDNWAVEHFSHTLDNPFDDTVTAEDVESCKPDPQFFGYTRGSQAAIGYRLKDYLHVAQSQYHDIGVAKHLGYEVCWIERRQGQEGFGGSPIPEQVTKPNYHFRTLAELANAVDGEDM